MKRIDPFARKLTTLIAVGMLLAATQLRAENVPQVVKVIRVEGKARWSTDGKNWKDVNAGDVYKAGTVIQTADQSLVDVVLGDSNAVSEMSMSQLAPGTVADSSGGAGGGGGGGGGDDEMQGNVIRIFSMTAVAVDKLTVDRTGVSEVSDTELDLRAGQIFVNVKKLSKQSRYEVKIPNGVAGIRGSGALISSVGIVQTLSGDVIVSVILGTGAQVTMEVPTGKWFNPTSGVVAEMSETDKKKLDTILKDLGVFVKALETLIGRDLTIHFCSPVDGTAVK